MLGSVPRGETMTKRVVSCVVIATVFERIS